MSEINTKNLNNVFDIEICKNDNENEEVYDLEIVDNEKEEIIKKNIQNAQDIMERVLEEINNGSFSANLVQSASSLINAIASNVNTLASLEFNITNLELKEQGLALKTKGLELKEQKLKAKLKNIDKPSIQNNILIVDSREAILKALEDNSEVIDLLPEKTEEND